MGAPFAVLVAEELFASGCRLLLSVTSAGQIAAVGRPTYFVIIERALRDEGTSYHYAAPSEYAELMLGWWRWLCRPRRALATDCRRIELDDRRSLSRNG